MSSLSQMIAESRSRGFAMGATREERARQRAFDTMFSMVCAAIGGLAFATLLCLPAVWSGTTTGQRLLGFAAVVAGALLLCSWRWLARFLPACSNNAVRSGLQLATAPVVVAWLAIYFNFIQAQPLADAPGPAIVALAWALMIPGGLLGGLAYGLEEATRRQADLNGP